MRIPLHIDPDDRSEAANARRFEHAVQAAQFNPQGFRQPGKRGTSLVIRQGVEARVMDDKPDESRRGREKRERRAQHVANVKAQQKAERKVRVARARAIAQALGLVHMSEDAA